MAFHTWTPGVLASGDMNDYIRDIFAGAGEWASYAPTWSATGTAPSIGNGALTGGYTALGDVVDLNVYLSIGSITTQGSGTWSFGLPSGITVASGFALNGVGSCSDGTQRSLFVFGAPSGTSVVAMSTGGVVLGPASPYTFPTGGWLSLSARFRKG